MLFTKASEYAMLSLILLSQANHPKDVDTISSELGISKSFLASFSSLFSVFFDEQQQDFSSDLFEQQQDFLFSF